MDEGQPGGQKSDTIPRSRGDVLLNALLVTSYACSDWDLAAQHLDCRRLQRPTDEADEAEVAKLQVAVFHT